MDILGIKTARHSEIRATTRSARVWVDIYQAYDLITDESEKELTEYLWARGFKLSLSTLRRIAVRAMARVRG